MSLQPLAKLEKLAGRRAEQSRERLRREVQQLQQIEHHRDELRSINHEYQQAVVNARDIAPQRLAHRRAFVEQLTRKLGELDTQSAQKRLSVDIKAKEHRHSSAQHAALERLNEQRAERLGSAERHREQQQLDEIARSRHFERNRMNQEPDNE